MTRIRRYCSPDAYLQYGIKIFNKFFLHWLDIALAPDAEIPLPYPPIFIIGAPRSGSTLLYQVLTDAFDVAYLSNRHCQFFCAPALAERIFKPLRKKKPSDFTSFHGRTKGWDAPSECGEWWYRFFRRDPAYVTIADVDAKKMRYFRRSLSHLTKVASKPLLFKNLYAGLRLEPISKFIPEALFIVIKREELYNAASILAGRKLALGTYNEWWSVPPPDVDQLKQKSACKQVIGQIRSIYKEINRVIDEKIIDHGRVFFLEYEQLCQNTKTTLSQIELFLQHHGIPINRRFHVPDSFPVVRNMKIEPILQQELREILAEENNE